MINTKIQLEIDLELPIFRKASTREEVAEFMGCGIFLIDREIKRGHLNARKINNGIVRIMPSDLLAWLEACQTAEAASQDPKRGRPRKEKEKVEGLNDRRPRRDGGHTRAETTGLRPATEDESSR